MQVRSGFSLRLFGWAFYPVSLRVTFPRGLAAQGVVPGTAPEQLSLGSILGLSRTNPSEFHISGSSSPRPQLISLPRWCRRSPCATSSDSFSISFPQGGGRGTSMGLLLTSSSSRGRGDAGGMTCRVRDQRKLRGSRCLLRPVARGSRAPLSPAPPASAVQPRRAEAPRAPRPRPGAPALPLAAAARPRSVPGSSAAQLT